MAMTGAPPVARTSGRSRWGWALLLAVLAPFLAETVASANTPAFLFPVFAPLYVVVYGLPALLLRELWVRGRLTAPRLLLAGVVYTAFNEGLIAATWFKLDKHHKVLGFTASQVGRSHGVNWSVAAGLVVFHTLFSLVVPLVVVRLAGRVRDSPATDRPWLGRWSAVATFAVLAFVVLGSLSSKAAHQACDGPAFDDCRTGRQISAVVVVAGAIVLAVLPVASGVVADAARRVVTVVPWVAAVTAASFAVAFFVGYFALPLTGHPDVSVALSAVLLLLGVAGSRTLLATASRGPNTTTVAACLGLLAPGMIASLRAWAFGQPVCAALALWLLWSLGRAARNGSGAARPHADPR